MKLARCLLGSRHRSSSCWCSRCQSGRSATAGGARSGTALVATAALVEEALEAGEVAGLATAVANRHADANLLANVVGFAVRNSLADGARNLLDHFLAFITAGGDVLLLDDFLGNHLADLHLANFFAWLPHLDGVGTARNGFLNSRVLRQQALQLGAEVEVLVAARIVAGVVATAAVAMVGMAASVAFVAALLNADLLADRVASFLALFADPFAAAHFDFFLFPNWLANDSLAFDHFGLVNGLAHHFTNFLHDCLGDSLVAGACPLFGHGLPLVFITYLGGTTGVRSRGTSHDGGSATAAATVSHRCGVGTEDSCDSCNGRGKELQAHLSALLCGETKSSDWTPWPGPDISPGGYSNVFKPIMRVAGHNAKEASEKTWRLAETPAI